MHIEYWDKPKIESLSLKEKLFWFDVYNHELEKDRGYNLANLEAIETEVLQVKIKKDYLSSLESLNGDNNFMFLTILYDLDRIVALCRVIKRDGIIYIAGLETHRDYRVLGYGKKVLFETISKIFSEKYDSIHSVIRKWNKSSIKTHLSAGFMITEDKGDNLLLSLGNIKYLVKPMIEEFVDNKIDKISLLSENFIVLNARYNFDISFNNKRYVAKLHSNDENTFSKIIQNTKKTHNIRINPLYFESRKYGYTHKFHLYGKEYWLWIEKYE
ncbi:MAG: GNAT family N-acetyltransferase [Tenericutes bacterium]|nr:GNAT family N-acetyltransferase [Mycoplasmatota bacterium]